MWDVIKFDYSGRKVLVTGGTNGIGYGIARAYLESGASVVITGTRPSSSDYDKDLQGFDYRQLQLTDNEQIQTVADSLGTLDILVNNAGASLPGGKDEYQADVFDEALQINLISAYRMAQACHSRLAQSTLEGGASIIAMGSLTSLFGNEIVPGYGAAKAGLVQLTKTLAIAWAGDGIRPNAIIAGLIESNMTAGMMEFEELIAPMLARTPLGRVGQPRDIAGAVLFLTSPAAAYITGEALVVDGGYAIRG